MGKRILDDDALNDVDEVGELDLAELADVDAGRFVIQPRRQRGPGRAKIDVLFQDDAILAINKPAGLDSVRGQFAGESVLDRLDEIVPDPPEPIRVVHRLDRDTTGVLILARTADAQASLTRQWTQGQVRKIYLAIVRGVVDPPEGTVELPVTQTRKRRRPVIVDPCRGKPAVTDYRLVEQYRETALVEAKPRTGRMHQIRVHLAAIGLPILVDHHYGSPRPLTLSQFKRGYRRSTREPERPLIDRLALHARRITFAHPVTGQEMTLEADLPKDFKRTIHQLQKFGR